jgi:hypothetical protein
MAIVANNDGVVKLTRRVGQSCELNSLLVKVFIAVSCMCLPLKSKIIKEKIAIHSTAREAHVICVPLYAAYLAIVAFALHRGGTFLGEEVIDQDAIIGLGRSK